MRIHSADVVFERVFPILAVADLEASLAYYIGVLGFDEGWRWGSSAVRAGVVRDAVELQQPSALAFAFF